MEKGYLIPNSSRKVLWKTHMDHSDFFFYSDLFLSQSLCPWGYKTNPLAMDIQPTKVHVYMWNVPHRFLCWTIDPQLETIFWNFGRLHLAEGCGSLGHTLGFCRLARLLISLYFLSGGAMPVVATLLLLHTSVPTLPLSDVKGYLSS